MATQFCMRINRNKVSLIVKLFSRDIPAFVAAPIVQVNRKTLDRYYRHLRHRLLRSALKERLAAGMENGIEIDESYFGPRRVRGRRGRGAGRKIVVLGLRKRQGSVYATIISDAQAVTILPIIREVVKRGSDIYTDGWRSYDALVVHGYNHKKVKHEDNEFVREEVHVNGIESFWSYAKRRVTRYNGIPKRRFPAFLLETEWRFNHCATIEKDIRQLLTKHRRKKDL